MIYETSIRIQAFPDDIWNILCNVAEWHHWNTTIDGVEGTIALRARIAITADIRPDRPFSARVTKLQPPHKMEWSAGMPLGLLRGKRAFTLTPQQDGSTDFQMIETFSGLLLPLFKKWIPDLQPSFDEFAICLKRAAETWTDDTEL